MTRTPVTVSATDAATLLALLLKAGAKAMQEDRTVVNEGYLVSFIGSQEENGPVFALVKAPTDEAYALIDAAFAGNVNITNAPVRVFLGDAMPEPSIDNLQIRLALNDLNLLETVDAAVAASPIEIQIWWAESLKFLKSDPMVQEMATQLKVDVERLDGIWALGATK